MDPGSFNIASGKTVLPFDISDTHVFSTLPFMDNYWFRCTYLVGVRYSTLARSIA